MCVRICDLCGVCYQITSMRRANKLAKNQQMITKDMLKHVFNKERFKREISVPMEHRSSKFIPYYIMEYLAGGYLRQHIQESFSSDDGYAFERRWVMKISFSQHVVH